MAGRRVRKVVGLIVCVTAAVVLGLPAESLSAAQSPAKSPATGKTTSSTKSTTTKKVTTKKKSASSSKTTAASKSKTSRQRAIARAAVQAKALAEAQQPRFKTDENGLEVPDVRAEAAIIYDPTNGAVLWESNSKDQRSIASITKVMTAVVYLEGNPNLESRVVVDRSDVRGASTTVLRAGYKVTGNDLLHLTLIASDNAAARALARTSTLGTQGFIRRMNEKALELGLANTKYVDSSGLLAANVSSAYDMARLISHVSKDERIAGPMRTQYYNLSVNNRTIQVHSTNQLVMRGDVDVEAGKTGFITKAGYCLATLLRLPEGGPHVAVVVLGAKSNAGRFWETRHLLSWLNGTGASLLASAAAAASDTPRID